MNGALSPPACSTSTSGHVCRVGAHRTPEYLEITRSPTPGTSRAFVRRMLATTRFVFVLLTVATMLGACVPDKSGASDSDTEGGSGSESSSEGVTTGDPLACMPGDTKSDACGNVCDCQDDGNWACTEKGCTALYDGFAVELTAAGGCSDVLMYAQNAGATISVEFSTDGLVAAAMNSGLVTKTDFTLPIAAVGLIARTGSDLHNDLCTDFIDVPPSVELTYTATAGSVSVTITPGAMPGDSSSATAEFKDVIWKLDGAVDVPTVSMPSLVMKDVIVGWLPG